MDSKYWDSLTEEEQDAAYRATLIHSTIMQTAYKREVIALGERIGYGNMMSLAQEAWREKLIAKGMPEGGEFVTGPCAFFTVPCVCEQAHKCDWCHGCGWLVKEVRDLIEAQNE